MWVSGFSWLYPTGVGMRVVMGCDVRRHATAPEHTVPQRERFAGVDDLDLSSIVPTGSGRCALALIRPGLESPRQQSHRCRLLALGMLHEQRPSPVARHEGVDGD